MWIWTGLFVAFSLVCVSIYIGEWRVYRRERTSNLIFCDEPWKGWFTLAFISLAFAVVTAIIAASPIDKLKVNADKVRSQSTTEGALK